MIGWGLIRSSRAANFSPAHEVCLCALPYEGAPLASARTGVRTNNNDRTTKRQRTQRSPSSSAQREARLSFPLGRTGDAMPHATCHMLFWGSVFYMPSDFGDLNYTNQTRPLVSRACSPSERPTPGVGWSATRPNRARVESERLGKSRHVGITFVPSRVRRRVYAREGK